MRVGSRARTPARHAAFFAGRFGALWDVGGGRLAIVEVAVAGPVRATRAAISARTTDPRRALRVSRRRPLRLSERRIAGLRRGIAIEVTDRGIPVGRLTPIEQAARAAPRRSRLARERDPDAPAPGALAIKCISYQGPNSTAMLAADRSRR